jgi:hypothetical protein
MIHCSRQDNKPGRPWVITLVTGDTRIADLRTRFAAYTGTVKNQGGVR